MAKVHRARFLTEDEYWSLPATGRTLADYWTEWLPKMCSRMKAEGTLVQTLEDEGYRLADLQVDLMQDGYPEDAAWEVVKQDLYALPPEDLIDKKNKAEKLRKAALEHKQRMDIDPTYRKEYEEIRVRLDKVIPRFGNDTDDQMDTPASAREIHKATVDKTEWDFIPKNAAAQCATCKNHIPFTLTCKAFPQGIPSEIMWGEWDHREAYPGDSGIRYDPVNPEKPVAPDHSKNKVQE